MPEISARLGGITIFCGLMRSYSFGVVNLGLGLHAVVTIAKTSTAQQPRNIFTVYILVSLNLLRCQQIINGFLRTQHLAVVWQWHVIQMLINGNGLAIILQLQLQYFYELLFNGFI